MLVAKRRHDGLRVIAAEEARDAGPWECPQCADPVAIKKGQINVHHFAHLPPVTCEYGTGESEEHRRCKTAIFESLRVLPGATDWELERNLGAVRPDVSGRINDLPLAIEVQASALGLERIAARTRAYAEKKIPVLWLGLWRHELDSSRFAPAAWERWLHTLYFGRVYYWREAARVTPVHFGNHMLHVEERSWYDSDGNENSAGGYDRVSKRWREAVRAKTIGIEEMQPTTRQGWSGGKMNVPASCLWNDRLERWW